MKGNCTRAPSKVEKINNTTMKVKARKKPEVVANIDLAGEAVPWEAWAELPRWEELLNSGEVP